MKNGAKFTPHPLKPRVLMGALLYSVPLTGGRGLLDSYGDNIKKEKKGPLSKAI